MPNTGLVKDAPWIIMILLHYVLGSVISFITWLQPHGSYRTPWKSAGDLLAASFDEKEYGRHPQGLYLDGSTKVQAAREAMDKQKQKALWVASLKMACLKDGDTVLEDWQR